MRRSLLLLCAALSLTGCEALQRTDSLFGLITPYRIDIVQGNAITKEQAALIKPGLARAQVREVLGTPLVADPFHATAGTTSSPCAGPAPRCSGAAWW